MHQVLEIMPVVKLVRTLSNKPEIALASGDQLPKNHSWRTDSGASQHVSPVKKDMTDFVKFKNPNIVKLADNSVLHAYGKETVQL